MGRFDAPGYGRGRAGRGRHSGGRGVGFGPGRGGGGGRGHSISASNAYQLTAEQKEAMLVPFLHPTPRALVPVPLEFDSVRHFCDLIANNLLAEFWHLIQEGPRGPAVKATPAAGGGLRVTSGDASGDGENATHHLLLIERRLHLVVSQSGGTINALTGEKTPAVLQLRPKLSGPHQGPIRSFGYVGAFVAELGALHELALRDSFGEAGSPALRAMLKPREVVAGHWHPPPLPEEDFAQIAASRGALRKVSAGISQNKKNTANAGGGGAKTPLLGLAAATTTTTRRTAPRDFSGVDVHAVAIEEARQTAVKEKNGGDEVSESEEEEDEEDEEDEDGLLAKQKTIGGVGANASQRAAVCALRYALEKIQGPPGTGKSTTIYHVITQRVPPGARVLVTCSRNVAIESIAQKLQACDAEMLVVGAPGRIGATARKHLLAAKIEAHPKVRAVAATSLGGFQSKAALEAAESVRGDLMVRCRLILCTIASTSRLLREWEEFGNRAPLDVHTVIVDECGCTPESSTALLLNLRPKNLVLLGDHNQLPPCSVINPRDLKNTGHDRSALERCVLGSAASAEDSTEEDEKTKKKTDVGVGGENQSSPAPCHRLTEQYRMHPAICEVVSRQFYEGTLTTAPSIARERLEYFEKLAEKEAFERGKKMEDSDAASEVSDAIKPPLPLPLEAAGKKRLPSPRPFDAHKVTTDASARDEDDSKRAMVWVQVSGREETPEEGTSYVNRAEVAATVAAARRVRERHGPRFSIAALTFYKGQYLALMDAMPASLGVECLTVDACQGSEFDFVLISTTRANERRAVGFVSDPRRINVAISRAKRQCVILGDARTMAGRPGTDWHAVASMCHRETFISTSRAACRWYAEPEAPGFVSVMHKKRADAKLPAESDDKKEEEAAGVNVGAAAFVPKAVLMASEAAAKAAQQLEKLPNAKERKKARKKNAAQRSADAAAARVAGYAQRGVTSMMHGGMMNPAAGAFGGHFPALGQGGGAPPGPVPAAAHQMPHTMMMPRRLVMASGSTPRAQTPPSFPAAAPPPPPPMPRGTVPGAAFAPPPGADDDEDWEPPAGRLGSALNLRELDVLGRSDSAGSFDAATQNFAMPPELTTPGSARPPAFSFGNG